MPGALLRLGGAVVACALLAACGASFSAGPPMPYAQRKAVAERLEKAGKLVEARLHWRALETIYGSNGEVDRKLRALEAKIEKRAETKARAGEQAFARGQTQQAKRAFLAALALDPARSDAERRLRQIEGRWVLQSKQIRAMTMVRPARPAPPPKAAAAAPAARQPTTTATAKPAAKTKTAATPAEETPPRPAETDTSPARDKALQVALSAYKAGEYRASIREAKKHLTIYPDDGAARRLLAESHSKVGMVLYDGDKLEESLPHLEAAVALGGDAVRTADAARDARSRLAERYYEQGMRIRRQDLDQAIRHWETSLDYVPQQLKARLQLNRAYKIRESLKSLKQE